MRRRPLDDQSVLNELEDGEDAYESSHKTTDPDVSSDSAPEDTPRSAVGAGDLDAARGEYWLSQNRSMPQHIFWSSKLQQLSAAPEKETQQATQSRTTFVLDSPAGSVANGQPVRATPPSTSAPVRPSGGHPPASPAASTPAAERETFGSANSREAPAKQTGVVPLFFPPTRGASEQAQERGSPSMARAQRRPVQTPGKATARGVCGCHCLRAGRASSPLRSVSGSSSFLASVFTCFSGTDGGERWEEHAARPRAGRWSGGEAPLRLPSYVEPELEAPERFISRLVGEVELLRSRMDRLATSAEAFVPAAIAPHASAPAPPTPRGPALPAAPAVAPSDPERALRLEPAAPVVGRPVRVVRGLWASSGRAGLGGVSWFRKTLAGHVLPIAGTSGEAMVPTADDVGHVLIAAVVTASGPDGAETVHVASERHVTLDERTREQVDALVKARRAVFWVLGSGSELVQLARQCTGPPSAQCFTDGDERCTLFVQPGCITLAHNSTKRELIARRTATIDLHPTDAGRFSLYVFGPPVPLGPGIQRLADREPEPLTVSLRLAAPTERDLVALALRRLMSLRL